MPAPLVPGAPHQGKGEEYVTLKGEQAAYKSPPPSTTYTSLDAGSRSNSISNVLDPEVSNAYVQYVHGND